MTKKSTIAVFLVLIATVVNAGPSPTNAHINDARKQVANLISDHFNRCPDGDYYARQAGLYHRPVDFIYQVRGIQFDVGPDSNYMPLGEVDRANGYQWRGAYSISARMTRRYHDGSWDEWEPELFGEPAYVHAVGLQNNVWYIEQIFEDVMGYRGLPLLPLQCSAIPIANAKNDANSPGPSTSTNVKQDPRYPLKLGHDYYPVASLEAKEEGRCIVKVAVSADGLVTDESIQTSTGYPLLDEACLNAFKGERLIPATENGIPVAKVVSIPVVWTLNATHP